MHRFKFAIVLIVAALGFFLGFRLGLGNRIYTDLVGNLEQEAAKLRGFLDYFTLGSIVYLFGAIAAKFTRTGSAFVVASALIIVLIDFSRRVALGHWSIGLSQLPSYAGVLLAYFSGVFAVFGLWDFCARVWKSQIGNGNT